MELVVELDTPWIGLFAIVRGKVGMALQGKTADILEMDGRIVGLVFFQIRVATRAIAIW